MFSSAYARFKELTDEFCAAFNHGDTSRMKHLAGRIVLLAGEVILVRFAEHLLERARG